MIQNSLYERKKNQGLYLIRGQSFIIWLEFQSWNFNLEQDLVLKAKQWKHPPKLMHWVAEHCYKLNFWIIDTYVVVIRPSSYVVLT